MSLAPNSTSNVSDQALSGAVFYLLETVTNRFNSANQKSISATQCVSSVTKLEQTSICCLLSKYMWYFWLCMELGYTQEFLNE